MSSAEWLQTRSRRTVAALETFLDTPIDMMLHDHAATSAENSMLALFHDVAATVPAYAALLKEHGIDPDTVQRLEDFQKLPLLTKENYLNRYPLAERCRNGRLEGCDMFAVSSGSTGQPTFWPRFLTDELAITARFEQIFRDSFRADERRTLAVVCFALGTWVGGMFTANCCRNLATKGYPVMVITPGNNKEEILRVASELSPQFEQTVLLGYPPFLKDVIDSGLARNIPWAQYTIKLVTVGEVYSEEWRTLVGERVGASTPPMDSSSLYGTADAGVLANETPLSITIRRYLAQHADLARKLFGESRLPTLAQYDPHSRFFEVHEKTLLFSGDNGVPLIRYHIADNGGLIRYNDMLAALHEHGFDPLEELKAQTDRGVYQLPFVYVFGRSHFTISYFGANIFPENVTVGLEQPGIKEWVTGKFVLESREDADRNRYLAVAIELAPDQLATDERRDAAALSILTQLRRLNSEFAHYTPPEYQLPHVTLHPFGDPDYFPLGVKHRYTRK